LGRTILVADDSPTIQKKASGILTGEGLDVVTVSNGVAAVKKLPTVNPVVVLADVSMPGKDGYEVCEYIKSNAALSNVFVLLIFSDTDPYEEAKGARVSADGKIKKPFDRDELVATVAKFVNQAEAAKPITPPPPPGPPPAFEVEPIEEEQPAPASPASDLAAFSGGIAFGVPSSEEMPPIPPEPMPAEAVAAPEELIPGHDAALGAIAESAMLVTEPGPDLVSEPAVLPVPELEIEHEGEAVPRAQAAEPMLVEEMPAPATEFSGERTMMFRAPADIAQPIFSDELEPTGVVAAEPAVAEALEPPVVEPAPVESAEQKLVSAAGAGIMTEPAVAEAPAEENLETQAVEPLPAESTEPELVSAPSREAAHEPAAAEGPVTEAAQAPTPEATAEQPVESPAEATTGPEPPPVAVEAPAAETAPAGDLADITPAEGTPVAQFTLESYSLKEAVAGHVRFAPPTAEAPPEPDCIPAAPEPEPAAVAEPEVGAPQPEVSTLEPSAPASPAEAPEDAAAPVAPAVTKLDPEQVFSIVHKVVVKMSPPALSPQMIEDIARKFADEIATEQGFES
jgi:CheY-like chemotaxis protein